MASRGDESPVGFRPRIADYPHSEGMGGGQLALDTSEPKVLLGSERRNHVS